MTSNMKRLILHKMQNQRLHMLPQKNAFPVARFRLENKHAHYNSVQFLMSSCHKDGSRVGIERESSLNGFARELQSNP
eukprot:gene26068-biopygen13511